MKFCHSVVHFFDKLEDRVRGKLSHWPITYAFTGGIGVVIFWRGVWHTMDFIMQKFFSLSTSEATVDLAGLPWWDGPLSLTIGSILLLLTGLFISNFIGNEILISGLRGEKKLTEKTETEVRTEAGVILNIKTELDDVSERLKKLEEVVVAKERK